MVPIYILIPAAVLSMYSSICCAQGMVIQEPEFVVHPQNLTVTERNIPPVLFTCTAINVISGEIDYVINGTSLSDAKKGPQLKMFFNQPPIKTVTVSGTKGHMGNLTLAAGTNTSILISLYNNTPIHCVADSNDNTKPRMMSNIAILKFQGNLFSVGDLSYSFIDSSTVRISWSPPFTLPGTDITGYNVSATASNDTTANHFTSNSYYELSLTDITDSPCTEVIITVSGYNGLDGDSSFVTVPSPVSGLPVQLDDDLDNNNAILTINLTNICPDLFPSSLTLTLFNSSDSIINMTTIPILNGSTIVMYDGFSKPENITYILTSYTVNGYTITTVTEIQGEDPIEERSPSTTSTVTSTIGSSRPLSTSSSSSSGVIGSTSVETSTLSSSPTVIQGGSSEPVHVVLVGVVVPIIIILVVIVVVLLIIYCYCYCRFKRVYKGSKQERSIIGIEFSVPGTNAPELPETGQPTYQDPSSNEREPPPTGDMYAQPDKSSRRRPPPQPELATYQDPNTIQRTQVLTGDLYAMPVKKSPNKTTQSGGQIYADLDTHLSKSSQPSGPLIPDSQVSYSDVNH